jgi:hypothetical protein
MHLIERKGPRKVNESDPEWVIELVRSLENNNVCDFSDDKKRILREQYLIKIKEGIKPKNAIEESIDVLLAL